MFYFFWRLDKILIIYLYIFYRRKNVLNIKHLNPLQVAESSNTILFNTNLHQSPTVQV